MIMVFRVGRFILLGIKFSTRVFAVVVFGIVSTIVIVLERA
jgi:hypothetical protein